jgi:hypothetical protein
MAYRRVPTVLLLLLLTGAAGGAIYLLRAGSSRPHEPDPARPGAPTPSPSGPVLPPPTSTGEDLRQQAMRARAEAAAAREAVTVVTEWRHGEATPEAMQGKEKEAEAAFAREDYARATELFREAAAAYRQAAAEAEKHQGPAQEAEDARAAMAQAKGRAEQANAKEYAPPVWAAARGKETDGQKAYDGKQYAAARDRFREAQAEYQRAAQEAQKVVVGQADQAKAQMEEARAQMEQARAQMEQAKGQAENTDAKQHAASLWASAAAKEGEGQKAYDGKQYVAARQRFQEAQGEYQKAAQEAQQRGAVSKWQASPAEQARAAMQQARQEAERAEAKRLAPPLFAAAEAKERDGQAALGRRDDSRARQLFQEAQAEYRRAAQEAQRVAALSRVPSAPPGPPAGAAAEIRKVLDDYKRAYESKDLALLLKVRPLNATEAKKVEASFKQSRSQRVDLTVQTIDVTPAGDQAEARGRRRDELVSTQGQKFEHEAAFVFKLRKTAAGWIIADAGGGVSPTTGPTTTRVERYPTIEAPDEVPVGQEFAVQVSLTVEAVTPGVPIESGETASDPPRPGAPPPAPRLVFRLPPDQESWAIDVVLSGHGFTFRAGTNLATIRLPKQGSSTVAAFPLRADPVPGDREARRLYATLWHQGAYLARVARAVTVVRGPPGPPGVAARPTPGRGRGAAFEPDRRAPDLTVFVLEDADRPGRGEIVLVSPHLQPSRHAFVLPPGLGTWLDAQYDRFVAELVAGPSRDRTIPLLRGFGRELYARFAPRPFKDAFWRLRDQLGPRFQTIQVFSNSPLLPWELMRPRREDGTDEQDFLGLDYRIARWHVAETGALLDRPPQALPMTTLAVLAPQYAASQQLPSQAQEIRALQGVRGYQRVAGRLDVLRDLLQRAPRGIIHFAGHGVVKPTRSGLHEYAIRLEDSDVDLLMFRGLVAGRATSHPFVFFNACSLGQAQRVANFVDGWAPATLEAGASGYVGGLWLLSDAGAAAFATRFYATFATALRSGPVTVAEVLRQVRRDFYLRGDPTFLAYVYYGDPDLQFLPAGAGG